jgi:phospho-N-acetylmuramoyl-pentapeptide-transferase
MSSFNALSLALGLILFSFSITSVFVVPFINFLYKFKIIREERVNKSLKKIPLIDKLHEKKKGTPVGGGIIIIAVVVILFAFLFPFSSRMGISIRSSYDFRTELFLIFFTFLSFGLLGLMDDLVKIFGKGRRGERPTGGLSFGLTRKQKMLLQWIPAFYIGWVLYQKLGIEILYIPLIDKVLRLGILFVPFSAFVIVSFSNAFNITDGLDGLASGLLIICLLAFGAIAAANLDTPLSLFIALWIGALLAFSYFNVYPARIFLGDAGALAFGATLGLIGLLTGNIIALLIIGGLFVVEALSSAIQILGWKFLKRPIMPLAPLHNSLQAIGWEEPKIVMRAWLAAIILAIFGLWLSVI